MPYTATHKVTGENTADQSSYNTNAILVTANKLVVGFFRAGAQPTSVTGGGITWTYYDSVTESTARLDVFLGVATSPTTQAITINYSGNQNECCFTIIEVDITVPIGGVTECVRQIASNHGGSISGITVTIPNSFADPDNITLGAVGTFQNGNITPGSGFTELGDAAGTGGSIQSQWLQGQDLSVDWTFASSNGVVAFAMEIGDPPPASTVFAMPFIST